jgi:hypothetical protein
VKSTNRDLVVVEERQAVRASHPAVRIVGQPLALTGAARYADRFEEMQALTRRRSHGLR